MDKSERIPVPVRYLDVSFGHGEEKAITIWPGDTLDIPLSGDILVESRTETVESIVMRAEHIRWYAVRDATAIPPLSVEDRAEAMRELLKAHADPGPQP